MRRMFTALTVAVCLLQQGEASVSGRVLGLDGTPAAGATVTLLHRPIARHDDPALEQRVVVTADERGRFKAALRSGALHSVWAATGAHASHVEEGVTAGDFVEVRLAPGTEPREVEVRGLDAWPEAATFTFRAQVGGEPLDFAPVPCRAGRLALPPLPPFAGRTIEVLRADGEVLWPAPIEGAGHVELPPPLVQEVLVTNAAGEPLAGAEVLAHANNFWATRSPGLFFLERFVTRWPRQGRTGADGRLTVRVPTSGGAPRLWLLTRKDGHRASLDGMHNGTHFRGGVELAAPPAEGAPLTAVLPAAESGRLPLRDAAGGSFLVDELFVLARVHVGNGKNGATGMPLSLVLPVRDGAAELTWALPADATTELAWATLAPAALAKWQSTLGFAPPAALRLPRGEQLLPGASAPQFDAAAWRPLRVVTADGRPAARIVVQLRAMAGEQGVMVRTDRLGRCPVPDGVASATVLCAAGAGHVAIAAERGQPIELQLQPVHRVPGRVVAAAVQRASDATIWVASRRDAGPTDYVHLLSLQSPAGIGADGAFELLLPPEPLALDVSVHWPGSGHHSVQLDWDPAGPAPEPIELRAAK